MHIQSWMIKSWATVEWYLPTEGADWPGLWHVSAQIRQESESGGLRSGDTVWAAQDDTQAVGVAWEWVEVRPGLVMLADPNSIITNLQLVDSRRAAVLGLAKTVAINRLVHALPWQRSVRDLLLSDDGALTPDARRQHLTTQNHGETLFQSDTTTLLSVEEGVARTNASRLHDACAPSEKPAVRPFQQRLQNHPCGYLKRSTDREDAAPTAATAQMRKAA